MPEAPESEEHDEPSPRRSHSRRRSRRRSESAFWLINVLQWFRERFSSWWYPPSEYQEQGYGYGHSRKGRAARAWQRFRRWIRFSAVGRGYRKGFAMFLNWWYPSSEHHQGSYGYGYGHSPKSRPARVWQRFQRWIKFSAVGRGYRKLFAKWLNWWYPPSEHHSEGYGYGYGHSPKSRPARAWQRLRRWLKHSTLGRWYGVLYTKFLNWWYVPSDRHSHEVENRLERSLRRGNRWVRKTWVGRKLEWVLDDAVELYRALRRQFRKYFFSSRFQRRLYGGQTVAWGVFWLTLFAVGYAYGWPRFRLLQETHYARQAEQLLTEGDVNRALIRSRQVLSVNVSNAIATRVFAEVADSAGWPAALYWRQRALLLDPGVTNQISLAATAVRVEQFPFPTAAKVLHEIAPVWQHTPEYQRVAGALALKLSQAKEAEQHFLEAYKLDPDNPVNRMSLAVIHLQSKDPNLIKDSRTTLELLMNNGQVGLLATRSLIAESMDRGDFSHARELSLQLLKNACSTFNDRILHLVILKASHSTNFASVLKETEEHARDRLAEVGALATWLNASGYSHEALDWLLRLPPEFTRQGLVPIAIAEAYAGLGQWKELEGYLRGRSWPSLDHIRFAMMALADAKQSKDQHDSVAWRSAIQLAASSPDALNTLARLASTWGWQERTVDLLWFAAQRYPDQLWPITSLSDVYAGQGNTAGMRRVAKAAYDRNPNDKLACNNYAILSLLLDADTVPAGKYAAELFTADPQNPVFASTYAFSLYKQGRAKDGVKILNDLPPATLDAPAMATYYGILLAASGDPAAAKHYLDQSAKAFLLPEEKALVARAKTGSDH